MWLLPLTDRHNRCNNSNSSQNLLPLALHLRSVCTLLYLIKIRKKRWKYLWLIICWMCKAQKYGDKFPSALKHIGFDCVIVQQFSRSAVLKSPCFWVEKETEETDLLLQLIINLHMYPVPHVPWIYPSGKKEGLKVPITCNMNSG